MPSIQTVNLGKDFLKQRIFSYKQITLLFLSLSILSGFLWLQITIALLQTLILLFTVALSGFFLINRLSKKLDDPKLRYLNYVFIIKLFLSIFVLHLGWTPLLDPDSNSFGYDPQRYFFDAKTLADADFDLSALPSLNYTGILFYYGSIFKILGWNPTIPALINIFVTLLATLKLVRVGYIIKPDRHSHDWLLGLSMLVPEVLWYDIITSRETLLMSLVIFACLTIAELMIEKPKKLELARKLLIFLFSIFAIGMIRTTVIIPIVVITLLLFIFIKKTEITKSQINIIRFSFLTILAAIIALIPTITSTYLGSYNFEFVNAVKILETVDYATEQTDFSFSERSLGRLFIADTPLKTIVFAPIRFLIYLVAPLPNIEVNFAGLINGDWYVFQSFFVTISSFFYILIFPHAIASLITTINTKNYNHHLIFHIPFWILMASIAIGNHIIHERYRIMAILLLCGCVWLGLTSSRRILRTVYVCWISGLSLSGLFFVVYKSI